MTLFRLTAGTALLALSAVSSLAGAQALDGKGVFAANCAACHQASGAGIPGAFPALKGNKFVAGDPAAVITTVLKGRGGMPTFADSIDDAQMAAVVSYLRSAWGNTSSAVTEDDVKAVRKQSKAGAVITKDQPTNVH